MLSFSNTITEYYLWLDSKYNVRRCDVLVQNKTIHSLNLLPTWSNISLKMATWAIGKTFHVIRGRVVCIIVFIVSIWSDLLVFCWWFMSNVECFHLIVLVARNKCGPATAFFWRKYNRQMYVRPTCSNLHTERFEVIFLTARWEQAHGATKWIKNNLLMIPPWIWFV